MKSVRTGGRVRLGALGTLVACGALAMGGCEQANYSAQVWNQTPQVLLADVYSTGSNGGVYKQGSARLGPGDHASLGPMRISVSHVVTLQVTTDPEDQRPARIDMRPGVTSIEVTQPEGRINSHLMIREVGY